MKPRFIPFILAVALSWGCSDDKNALALYPSTLTFAADQSAPQQVTVSTDAYRWEAASRLDWIYLAPQSGTLLVSVERNDSAYQRQGTVSVQAGSARAVLVVIQKGASSD